MKKFIYTILIGTAISVFGCKKPDEVPAPASHTDRAEADDASARNELDKVYDDIEKVYNSPEYRDGSTLRTTGVVLPCGSVSLNAKNFTIQYNGVNCGSRTLSGSIAVTLLTSGVFSDPNAKLKIVYNNYKVLYYTNNQSITYNGTMYVTNGPNGGTLLSLFTTTPATVVHEVRGQLSLTFDSTGTGNHNVIREWNVFREKTYTSNGTKTGITYSVKGDTSILADTYIPGTYSMASEYGISRDGDKFVCNLSTPFTWSNCGSDYLGPYNLKQGKVEYTVDLSTNQIALFGVTKGTWSATAGYRYDSPNNYPFDGSCTSNGYKLDFALKNSSGANVFTSSSFQAY
jgi:hypothetical protein